MKKILVGALASGLLFAGSQVAIAAPAPHEPQDQGLCTAYYNGNKNGWEKKGSPPPPFQDLIQRADDADGNGTSGQASDLAAYCDGLVGGNPGPNGKSDGKGNGGN